MNHEESMLVVGLNLKLQYKVSTQFKVSALQIYVIISDAYILFRGTTTIIGAGDDGNAKRTDKRNKEVTFKILQLVK